MAPRLIVVHVDGPGLVPGPHIHAHCFGPFETEADAEAHEALSPDDTCTTFLLDLVGPGLADIERSHAEHDADPLVN